MNVHDLRGEEPESFQWCWVRYVSVAVWCVYSVLELLGSIAK